MIVIDNLSEEKFEQDSELPRGRSSGDTKLLKVLSVAVTQG